MMNRRAVKVIGVLSPSVTVPFVGVSRLSPAEANRRPIMVVVRRLIVAVGLSRV